MIKRAVDAGCVKLMVTGSDLKQSRKAVRLAEEYSRSEFNCVFVSLIILVM